MKLTSFLDSYNPRVLHRPYMIAEAGVNHEGSMDLEKRLIDEAAEGGAPQGQHAREGGAPVPCHQAPVRLGEGPVPRAGQEHRARGYPVRAVEPVDGAKAVDGDDGSSASESSVRRGNGAETA